MRRLNAAFIVIIVTLCRFQAECADKYTDQNRPYEFGFTIDGEQHRHEKKDENGIIMGEFGFITADGVYHVTVYATDENGNFKILSMKNIRVKPYPTGPGVSGRQGHSLQLPQTQQPATAQVTAKAQQPQKEKQPKPEKPTIKINAPVNSCSHCSIPTTSTAAPKETSLSVIPTSNRQAENIRGSQQLDNQYNAYNNVEPNYQQGSVPGQFPQSPSNSDYPNQLFNGNNQQQTPSQQNSQVNTQTNYQQDFNVGRQNLPSSGSKSNAESNTPLQFGTKNPQQRPNQQIELPREEPFLPSSGKNKEQNSYPAQSYSQPSGTSIGQTYPVQNNVQQNYEQPISPQQNYPINSNNYPSQGQSNTAVTQDNSLQNPLLTERQPKTFKDILQSITPDEYTPSNTGSKPSGAPNGAYPEKPVLVAGQMQIINKNTDIYHKEPGEMDGLPKGLSKGDMKQLLYTFNYTVAFHGHHEEGYTDGAKVGYYFVTGRNGVRTRVDYVADETGFHPRISQEVLDIQSEDVPKPETEKDEKFGLKGYEFKWLYYPVYSK